VRKVLRVKEKCSRERDLKTWLLCKATSKPQRHDEQNELEKKNRSSDSTRSTISGKE
jgi:hypothetical protein